MRHSSSLWPAIVAIVAACGSSSTVPAGGGPEEDPSVDFAGSGEDSGTGAGEPGDDGGPGGGGDADADADGDGDGNVPPEGPTVGPGGACACDAECIGDAEHAGLCIHGICGTRAAATECEAGSRGECPDRQRCWSGTGDGVCYPDFVEGECAGQRDADGSCVAAAGQDCFASCGELCGRPGEPSGDGGGGGGGDCPSWECAGQDCEEIVAVPGSTDPESADALSRGYFLGSAPEYQYLRQDVMTILQWAFCEMHARHPEAPPVALLDLTTADGTTPGCENGPASCRHPEGTHQGTDADTAYFQTDGDNDGEIICGDGTDDNANGQAGRFNDGYFCTTEDNVVDVALEIELLQLLDSTGRVRVVGVDQTLADDLEPSGTVLGYGNDGGWAFHHHHTHDSFTR